MPPLPLPSPHNLLPRLSAVTQRLAKRIPALPLPAVHLHQRQDTAVIPSAYKVDGPQPSAVAGIVLGSVCGFLLLVMLIYFLTQGNSNNSNNLTITGQREEIVRRDKSPGARRRSQRSSRSERIETRERSPRPMRTTIVEETRRAPRRSASIRSERIVDERIVEESSRRGSRPPSIRRVDGDDIVEVIEEGSSIGDPPPRRDRRRRSSGYRY